MLVVPSPKFQNQFVIVPLEASLNVTTSGFKPFVGLPMKSAAGDVADIPISEFVLPPSLPEVITTALLKLPAFRGLNCRVRFVDPNPGTVKGVPEIMRNGPPRIIAVPLLTAAPPKLVKSKLNCLEEPAAMIPKSSLEGETDNCAGVRPVPVIELVLLPPLLVNMTALLKLPELPGLNTMLTEPV